VNDVGQKVVAVLPPQPFKYRFYVIKEDGYNAFASPAGHIFVNSGLIEAMESEEELAGVIAHEIAHVSLRHISKKIERSKKIGMATLAGVVAGVLLGSGGAAEAASAVTVGTLAAGQSVALAYSRDDEAEADQVGLEHLNRAGYSAQGLLTVLKKCEAGSGLVQNKSQRICKPTRLQKLEWYILTYGSQNMKKFKPT
jgi:predicted Zn-dependent protease